jgi:3,4-dihydroxy-2-butanone 4-phosphate synthase
MCGERAEQLGLDMMVPVDKNTNPKGTAFAVPTDAIGTGTGVSAVDRAITFNCLANSEFGKNKFR